MSFVLKTENMKQKRRKLLMFACGRCDINISSALLRFKQIVLIAVEFSVFTNLMRRDLKTLCAIHFMTISFEIWNFLSCFMLIKVSFVVYEFLLFLHPTLSFELISHLSIYSLDWTIHSMIPLNWWYFPVEALKQLSLSALHQSH